MSVPVVVTTGIGMWKATTRATLVACPHVGDTIEIGDVNVSCDRVCITEAVVIVDETQRFQSLAALEEFKRDTGWE